MGVDKTPAPGHEPLDLTDDELRALALHHETQRDKAEMLCREHSERSQHYQQILDWREGTPEWDLVNKRRRERAVDESTPYNGN